MTLLVFINVVEIIFAAMAANNISLYLLPTANKTVFQSSSTQNVVVTASASL